MKFVKVFVALLGGSGKSDWLIEIASGCVICQCQIGAEDYESESGENLDLNHSVWNEREESSSDPRRFLFLAGDYISHR